MNPVSTVKTSPSDFLMIAAGAGRAFDSAAFSHRIVVRVPSAATEGAFSVAEGITLPWGRMPLPGHDRREETLSAHFLFEVGDKTLGAGLGDMIYGGTCALRQ